MSGKAEPIAAALAILAGKPVRFVYDRKEDFIASTTRHSGYITVKLGAKRDGSFQALYLNAVLNTGGYANAGPDVTAVLGVTNISIYQIPQRIVRRSLRLYKHNYGRCHERLWQSAGETLRWSPRSI